MEINLKAVRNGNEGSALLVVVIMIAILTFMAATLLENVGTKCRTTYHSGAWVEALNVAETGAEIGLLALNGTNGADPSTWTSSDWSNSNVASPFVRRYSKKIAGHGNVPDTYVSVLVGPKVTANGQTWCRVRSTGVATIPGATTSDFEGALYDSTNTKNRNLLRNLSLSPSSDKTGGLLPTPQVSRTVETTVVMTAPPKVLFPRVLTTAGPISFDGNTWFDSYDPTNANKSINFANGVGQYPGRGAAKTGTMGDIATNSSLQASGSVWATQASPTVYGNGYSNGGVWPPPGRTNVWQHATVTGAVSTKFSTTFDPVVAPTWSSFQATPARLLYPSGIPNLIGGTVSNPNRYKLTSIDIEGSSTQRFSNPTGVTESYIEIYVDGPTLISAGGSVVLDKGVHVTMYVNGNVEISGNGFTNTTGLSKYLTIYGVPAASGARTFVVSNSGAFIGTVYAPTYDLSVTGASPFIGAGVFKSATLGGSGQMHYDESLSTQGASSQSAASTYKVASLVEDIAP